MKASPASKSATVAAKVKVPMRRAAARAMPLADLQARAGDAAALLKALANPDRLLLLCHLVEAERAVGELGEATGIGQPTLSQQLGVLRAEGLVATRREGKAIFYRIASPDVLAVLQTLYGLFCEGGHGAATRRRTSAGASR